MRDFLAATRDRVIVFDGGMGATLEQFDLDLERDYKLPGRCHEALVLNRPDVIRGVHESMVEAGAEVVETDTFQGSRIKLDEWGLGDHTLEINRRAAEIARRAVGEQHFVAGSIGPTGFLPASDDPTLGSIRFRDLVEVFEEQGRGLLEGGADLIIIETAQDILEVKAAIFGVREAFKATGRSVPIQTSVSLLPNGGKMLLGTDISAALTTLEALKVDVIGLNCSTGPEDMRDAVRFLGEHCPVPIHCIPNAGIPHQGPNGETIFPAEPEPLADVLGDFVERYGLGIVGGCCGTTTEHIRAIAERCTHHHPKLRPAPRPPHVSSMMAATPLAQEPAPTLVGERVNSQGSRKAKEMLLADDYDGLVQVAEDQVEGGAHVLDLCVALTERQDEDEQMRLVAKKVSLTQPAPIQVDSTEPEVIETALEQIPGRAIVNSVNLEAGEDKLNRVVPIAMAHGAALIALTIDEVGMAKTRERKLEVARRITDLVCNRRDAALEIFIQHFESKGPAAEAEAADPTAGMEPEEALHWHILRRKKDGVEAQIDASVEKIGAVPTLNDVLLPAMKEVGDKFGAGELILPFVLQSAEVMKRAVAQLENYLDKTEGYTKGTVVLATVFGDVHDIGKSLVNTILTNNGYSVVDLGKQVPIGRILDAAQEHDATAIGLSALLVSTSKQMPLCVQELHANDLQFPLLVGGAAINRKFGLRANYPDGKESDAIYEPGVFYCKDAFEGLAVMDQLVDGDAREQLVEQVREDARKLREEGETEVELDFTDDSVRSPVATDNSVPEPPFWGVREIPVDLDEVYPHLDTHVLFKLHWGGRGVKGEEWKRLLADDFRPRLERMWREQDYLRPRALVGYFPCYSEGNEIVVLDPDDRETVLERLVAPRQPTGDRICLADFFRPRDSGELDVVALQAVTAGDEVTELMARLEAEGEFAEQLFTHGLGVQTAEGMAEWLHWRIRRDLGIPETQGRRYSWGYPAIPEQSEHEKVYRLLGATERIGLRLSGGYAVEPEQSTLALVAHHPEAIYFGTTSGRLLPDGHKGRADDVIKGSPRDPSLFGELDDAELEPAASG